ncbi:hypothetical protein [Actinoplanes sp. GCM10030250]|uniref:hypothetical protein n=1 Tax=Actinoplanes sp. GCM10030250 TaxID=3273376 RepID=UPI00361AF0E0
MTTNQTTTGNASEQLRSVPAETSGTVRQAAETARTKATSAGQAARRHPAPVAATALALAGAVAAAVYFTRRRTASQLTRRQRLTARLTRH